MNLNISDASLARIKLALSEPAVSFGPELQYKQHPNVGKFAANKERVIALKDPSRSFPVGQSLAVLKWRYAGKDESYVPLSSACTIYSSLSGADIFSQSTAGPHHQMTELATSTSNMNLRMRA